MANTPRHDGFSMPAEFAPHQATWMSWPTSRELWEDRLDEARDEWAGVANAVAAFEPVIMVCQPGSAADVRRRCSAAVEPLEAPIDDSWLRDNGPIFVTNADGDESIAIHSVGVLAMAWDHRAFDGAYAAAFLNRLREILETYDWEAELA